MTYDSQGRRVLQGQPSTWEAEAKALRARVQELEKVLKPFSKITGEMFARNWNKGQIVLALDTPEKVNRLTFDDFLAAHAALQQDGGE